MTNPAHLVSNGTDVTTPRAPAGGQTRRLGRWALGALTALSLVALIAPVLLAPAPVSAQDAKLSAEQVAERIQTFYATAKDYQARFKQTYTDLAAGKESTSQGKVFFKKPGKMRWDYTDTKFQGMQKLLVSDGTAFTIYEKEFDQYYRQCLRDSSLPTALSFLMGTGNLLNDFNVKLKGSTAASHTLELVPKKSEGQYKKLLFVVNASDFSVISTTVYDPYGNKNVIEFISPAINKSLPDAGFNFTIPDGVRPLHNSDKIKCN